MTKYSQKVTMNLSQTLKSTSTYQIIQLYNISTATIINMFITH